MKQRATKQEKGQHHRDAHWQGRVTASRAGMERGGVAENFSLSSDHSNCTSNTTNCTRKKRGAHPTFTVQNWQWNTFSYCFIVGLNFYWWWGEWGGGVLLWLNHTQNTSWNSQFKWNPQESSFRFWFCPEQTIAILVIMKIMHHQRP